MGIFRLKNYSTFIERPEVFPDVHLARADTLCLVVGCRVVITFDDKLDQELGYFFNLVWGRLSPGPDLFQTVLERYSWWLSRLNDAPSEASPVTVTRSDFWPTLAATFPPPPPNRPGVAPAYTPPPSLPANYYGHLPFQKTSEPHEHFYRFEAWPQSRKITIGSPGQIAPGTYASPASELPFIPTGFSAVARAALPSYFPAVFRYVFEPVGGTPMRCGAVIPNYGQSGGGVEVFFPNGAASVGAIANPVLIEPF